MSGQLAAVVTSSLVAQTNGERADAALGSLTVNPQLVAAAQAKADDMARKGYFAHTSPDGTTSWQWLRDAGYRFAYAGENLAVNFSDSRDVTDAWMRSPTHRANILNGRFTEVGIATAVGEYKGKEAVFVVQMFGTPAAGSAGPSAVPVPADAAGQPARTVSAERTAVLGVETGTLVPIEPEPAAGPAAALQPESTAADPVPAPAAAVRAEGVEPAAIAPAPAESDPLPSAAGSPRTVQRAAYALASVLLLAAVALAARAEFRKHHARHAFAAVALFLAMGALLAATDRFLFPAPTIGGDVPVADSA